MNELTYKRSVRYYHIYFVQKNKAGKIIDSTVKAPPQWDKRIQAFFATDGGATEVFANDVHFYPQDSDEHLTLSMHRPLESSFLTEIDTEQGQSKDFTLLDGSGSRRLANATAVVIGEMNERLVAGLAAGTDSRAPGVTPLKEFLQKALALPSGWQVKYAAVTLASDRELLEKADGALAFSGEFISDGIPLDDPISKSIQKMAGDLGVDVKAYVRFELENKNTKLGRDKFLGVIKKLPFSNKGKVKPRVTVSSGSVQRVLTLASHQFASEIFLRPDELIGAKFSSLIKLVSENFNEATIQVEPIVENFIPPGRSEEEAWEQKLNTPMQSSDDGDSPTLF